MKPKEMLVQFDLFLADREVRFEAVVIGGAALALLGVITRETQDCDVLDPSIPEAIATAAREFSQEISARGEDLREDWLNNGPEALKQVLPEGWLQRIKPLYSGAALQLQTLGRADLLKTKLFAYCDRGQDLSDCVALRPTQAELLEAADWLQNQDAHAEWPTHVERTLAALARRLGYGP